MIQYSWSCWAIFQSLSLLVCSSIDGILVDYIVSVLEELGQNPNEFETTFDVDEFTEMMAAYVPGFKAINR